MEMITAIALLCQINIGLGSGVVSNYSVENLITTVIDKTEDRQQTCQNKLARCILKKDKSETSFRQSTFLKCIKER